MNTASFYRATLRRALRITARHKTLWILGFLAAFLGNGGEYEFLLNQFGDVSRNDWGISGKLLSFLGAQGQNGFLLISKFLQNLPTTAFILAVVILVLFLLVLWLSVSAQGGLIKAVLEHEEEREVSVRRAFAAGRKSFWQLLSILIVSRLLAVFVLAAVGLPLIALMVGANPNLAPQWLILIFFVLAVPTLIIFSLIGKLAVAYEITAHYGWRASFISGLSLFASHWLVALEMALLLFIINLIAGIAFVLAIALIALPFLLISSFFAQAAAVFWVALFAQVGVVLFLLLLLLFGSALSTFQNSAWALLFLRIRNERHMPKLLRILDGWRAKYA